MKHIKILSIILIITILFSSCSLTFRSPAEEITQLFSKGEYNKAIEIFNNMTDKNKNKYNSEFITIVTSQYDALIKKYQVDLNKMNDISAISVDFTDECRSLWNFAQLIVVDKSSEQYNKFINIKYFSVICELMQYNEIYLLVKDMTSDSLFVNLDAEIKKYSDNADNFDFNTILTQFKKKNLNKYNPTRLLVNDFIKEYELITKYLTDLCEGFKLSSSSAIGSNMSSLKKSMGKVLYYFDTVVAIYTKTNQILNTLKSSDNLNQKFNTEINVKERDYLAGSGFDLSFMFGRPSDNISLETPSVPNGEEKQMSKKDALTHIVNSVNKLKTNKGNVTVIENVSKNIRLTDIVCENSNLNALIDLEKQNVVKLLDKVNKESTTEYKFDNGTYLSYNLYDIIPPTKSEAKINENIIDQYKVITGSSGTIITLLLKKDEVSISNPVCNIYSLVNGFNYDDMTPISNYKTSYYSTFVQYTINGQGQLTGLEYILSGINSSEYIPQNINEKATATFSFENKYKYSISY